jgi:hypothetical protein
MRSDRPGICVDPSRDSNTQHGRMQMVKLLTRSENEIILVSVCKAVIPNRGSAVPQVPGYREHFLGVPRDAEIKNK